MDEIPDGRMETDTADAWTTDPDERRDGPERDDRLEAIVVRYRNGRDRCTFVPRDGAPESMLTAWLSTDLEAVVALEEAR
ncbi:hypothetical protein [Haloterrigena salinisoli]|uniref:DUF7511 domain-containing protein n=1 Tax=Haloterrigena salinisoli TaxID=3132747 RepID=UPI0030CE0468